MILFEKTVNFEIDENSFCDNGWIHGKIKGYSYKFLPWEWIKEKWKKWRK